MIFDIIVSCCEKQAELLTSSMTEFERRREWKEQNITREKQVCVCVCVRGREREGWRERDGEREGVCVACDLV